MKRALILFVIAGLLSSFSNEAQKVLIFVRDGSIGLEYMLNHEVYPMKDILEEAGLVVSVASMSGEIIQAGSASIMPDIKLSEVRIDDFAGFILPCMASDSIHPEMIKFAEKVVNAGKPIAAQLGSVMILAEAGILDGKKYAFANEEEFNYKRYPLLNSGIYSGMGVVQDGLIITSGICPWIAKEFNRKDCTAELTNKLVASID
jgi:putative intracellular protease/amidase